MTDDSWTGGGAAALKTYAPDVLRSYDVLVSVRPSGVHDEMLESPAVAAFAEQFGADSSIEAAVLTAFVEETGAHATAVTRMVWIADVAPRVRAALDAVFGPTETWPGRRRYPVADTGVAVEDFLESVDRLVAAEPDGSSRRPDAAGAALGLADAMARNPTAIPEPVVEAVHELLTPVEAVEVVLGSARRSADKLSAVLVA